MPGDTDRDVLGLMMAGVPLEEAARQAAEHHTTLGEADARGARDLSTRRGPLHGTRRTRRRRGAAAQAPPDGGREPRGRWSCAEISSSSWLVSVLAVVLALVLGGVLIAAADPEVQAAARYFFSRPADFFSAAWTAVSEAYAALFRGAIYDPQADTFARRSGR